MEDWVGQHRSRRLGTPALGGRWVTPDQQADSIVQPMG
jgi:hypothetical protein